MKKPPARKRTASVTVWALGVGLLSIVPFLPAIGGEFVSWDDDRNFLGNPDFRGLAWPQLKWMWSTFHMGHYIPLSWMTLGADYVAWGMNPLGYHLTNLALHGVAAVLLFFVARRLLSGASPDDKRLSLRAGTAALLFAVHPLRVESVAWITERRDMLSMVYMLASVLWYLEHAERGRRWSTAYWLSFAAFVCALLSKGITVTLPAVLVIVNAYPLRRIGGATGWWTRAASRVYAEIAPFALTAAGFAGLTVIALHAPAQLPFAGKLAVSAYSLVFYLWKTVAPAGLAPLYEMPKTVRALSPLYAGCAIAVVMLAALVIARRKANPGVAACAAAYFVITLPLLGVIQNGPQIAADRYTYHSAPALALLAAGTLDLLPSARLALGFGAGIVALLGALTWRQSQIWRTSEQLWTRVVAVDSTSSIGHVALGSILVKDHRYADGIAHYEQAIEFDPSYAESYNNLGVALAETGRMEEAVAQYRKAVSLKSGYDEAEVNLAVALAATGDTSEARRHFETAVAINPSSVTAFVSWGNSLTRSGVLEEGVAKYNAALRLAPENVDALRNEGAALARLGRLDDAIRELEEALRVSPGDTEGQRFLEAARALRDRRKRG